jgi:hypothetical protein
VAEENSRDLSDAVPDARIGGRCPRGSARSNLRSSHFYRPDTLSCDLPLSVLMGEESPIGGDSDRYPPPY